MCAAMFFPVWAFSQAGSVEWFWRCPNFNILSAPTLFAHTATGHHDCRFRPDPANPVSVSKLSTVYRIGRGNSTRKSIHPNYLYRRAYQPPSPDPHDRSRGGGFFCQRFFARLEMHTSDVTYARLSVICVMSTLMNTRLHALNRNALSLLSRAFPSLRSSLAPTSARSSNRGSSGIRPVRSDCDGLAVESFAQNHLGGHPRDGSGVFRDILQ